MKHCEKCNIDYPDHFGFCTRCGNKLTDVIELKPEDVTPEDELPPVSPQSVSPQPVAPQPVNPQPAAPQPVDPQPAAPQPVDPQPAASQPVDPNPNKQKSKSSEDNRVHEAESSPSTKPKSKVGKIVKRIFIGLGVALVLFFLWISHLVNSTTYLDFNSEGECFTKNGGYSKVNIDYDGYVWEVTYAPDWVEVSEYDDSFGINCEPNTTGNNREDHITIKSGKIVSSLPIGQYGKTQYIRLSENRVSSNTKGTRVRVKMETDGSGPEISYPDFCRIEDLTNDGFVLVVNNNDSYSRNGTVKVYEDNKSASIYVNQKGVCRDCGGSGVRTCSACGGLGSSGWGYYSTNCFACGGTGRTKCFSCGGTGIK